MFRLYKYFLSKFNNECSTDNCLELDSTSVLNNDNSIPKIISASLRYTPVFINRITDMSNNRDTSNIKNILSGTAFYKEVEGNINKNEFTHGNFYCENYVPILIYADNKVNTQKFNNNYEKYLYILDFKDIDISDEDFKKYSSIISSINNPKMAYIISCFLNYKKNGENVNEENVASIITKEKCIPMFVKECCKRNKGTYISTVELFRIFQAYAFNEHSVSVEDNWNKTFSRLFKSISGSNPTRSKKERGYEDIIINYNAKKLSEIELSKINTSKKVHNKSNFSKMLDSIFQIS